MDPSQNSFKAIELNQDLLATPFEVQTNRHVLTGTPCSGKITLIDMLAEQGFQMVAETGRQYIECEMAKGRTLAEICDSKEDERCMDKLQLSTEHRLRPLEVIFLDRAIPDCLPFYRLNGMDPNEMLVDCFHYRYASIFVLNRLPLELDGVRLDDDPLAVYLDEWLARDYDALGYNVSRVGVLPAQERLAFILKKLTDQEMI